MDWQKFLKTLSGRGLRQKQIADACGCSQSFVSELSSGKAKNPSYQVGAALLALERKTAAPIKRTKKKGGAS